MKVYVLSFMSFLMLSISCYGAEKAKKALSPKEVAKIYFEALIGGKSKVADKHSCVPFFFDGKDIIRDKEKLSEMHKQIEEKKGKRAIPSYKISKGKKAEKLDESIFPAYLVFRITIDGDDETIYIYVTKGKNSKAIGFRD